MLNYKRSRESDADQRFVDLHQHFTKLGKDYHGLAIMVVKASQYGTSMQNIKSHYLGINRSNVRNTDVFKRHLYKINSIPFLRQSSKNAPTKFALSDWQI